MDQLEFNKMAGGKMFIFFGFYKGVQRTWWIYRDCYEMADINMMGIH